MPLRSKRHQVEIKEYLYVIHIYMVFLNDLLDYLQCKVRLSELAGSGQCLDHGGLDEAAVFASTRRGGCIDPFWRLAHDGLPFDGRHIQFGQGLVGRIIECGAGSLHRPRWSAFENDLKSLSRLLSSKLSSVALLCCWELCRTVCAGTWCQVVSCRLRASFIGCTLPINLAGS